MEAELVSLQESNAKLVSALHEANCSIEQWKKQLAEYQEETDRLREQVDPTASCALFICLAQGHVPLVSNTQTLLILE